VGLYGLGAGLVTVAFQLAIHAVYRLGLGELSRASKVVFLCVSFPVVLGTSLAAGWLLNRFCKEAAGSGIPQMKVAFWKDFGHVPWRVVWVKFLAGVLSIGGGASLGREGPSVQLAGAVGSQLAGLTGEPRQNRRAAAAAGSAAGLAAAFNTPLAAITFVLEEIIGDLNSRLLGSVLLASVLGALVVHGLVGKQPAFSLLTVEAPSWLGYALTPLVAGLASLVGVYFQRVSLKMRAACQKPQWLPAWMVPAYGGLITWALGAAIFWNTGHLGVFSLGYDDLSLALAGKLGWLLALVLLAAKFAATCASYGAGGCGGIFAPSLFFGGMTGVVVAGLVGLGSQALGFDVSVSRADLVAMVVVGMSACLGAVVWAPVTGILIVFEMTHEFGLVPALMIGALVSQTISRKMNRHNFYEAILVQDGLQIERVRPPRDLQSWQQLPISAIANFQPVFLRGLDPESLRAALQAHAHARFPVVLDKKLAGQLSRREMEESLREQRPPALSPLTACLPSQTIRDLQRRLIESDTNMVAVLDRPDGRLIGIVTLHDLLRSQTALAEAGVHDSGV